MFVACDLSQQALLTAQRLLTNGPKLAGTLAVFGGLMFGGLAAFTLGPLV